MKLTGINLAAGKHNHVYLLLIVFAAVSCNQNPQKATEKHFKEEPGKTVSVENSITDIPFGSDLGFITVKMLDSFLVITDSRGSSGKALHLLSSNTFSYVASAGIIGKGPGEVIRTGDFAYEPSSRTIWLNDHGKECTWAFPIDSVLTNPDYKPTRNLKLNHEFFFSKFSFLNDSIAIGVAVHPLIKGSFENKMAVLNINTNQLREYGYEQPKAKGRYWSYFYFSVLKSKGVYVKAHSYLDLLTICNLNDGSLRYNVYGKSWNYKSDKVLWFFIGVDFYKDYIIAAYVDDVDEVVDRFGRARGNGATRFVVFDLEGDYVKTIETGNKFSKFCIDEQNARIIVYFTERENPIGYFSLKDIL